MAGQFILLNGPPECGKDTLAGELLPYLTFTHMKFAAPMKRAIASLLDIPQGEIEGFKNHKSPLFQHRDTSERDTVRQALISMSEDHLKKRYGDDFFGRAFWQIAKNVATTMVVASDCGFASEVVRVVGNAGRNNCLLIRLHRIGKTFEGDSRSYMPDGLCDTYDFDNNSTPHMLTMKVLRAIVNKFHPPLLREPDWIKI